MKKKKKEPHASLGDVPSMLLLRLVVYTLLPFAAPLAAPSSFDSLLSLSRDVFVPLLPCSGSCKKGRRILLFHIRSCVIINAPLCSQ